MSSITANKTTNRYLRDNLLFLAKAVNKPKGMINAHALALAYIKIEDNTGWASDTKRLHKVKGIELDDGAYKIIKSTKSEIIVERIDDKLGITFPEFEKAFPINTEIFEIENAMGKGIDYLLFKAITLSNNAFNPDLFKPLEGIDWETMEYIPDENKPIVFNNGVKQAVLMPKIFPNQ